MLKSTAALLLVGAGCSTALPVSLLLVFGGVSCFWLSGTDAAKRY